ncbi:Dolichyl-phosphate-mannose-protein mannosyltransferase [Pseudonocardia thermophila]|uniref:Dolichyl-phosphate-mannose-protein mannosyltransferase n=1 Tax=Pseudonocardia thermophila TaxID=1848 RepID=A0A1M6RP26_PSETH|nr:glycosyltransferase family 39 protein [Pseudonocardia thermophila]SHK34203.1 Dolichyl-phosphate-mannose-protein mannosyltransferase [Pseudonocardia thermophila]
MTATASDRAIAEDHPAFARGPVLAVAAAVGLLLTAVSGRYGYFGDELYFVAAGHHLAWGYADQPPLVPLLALVADTVAPGSVAVLRIPATLATTAVVVLAALLARELGGGRRAQLVAAGAVAVSPTFLGTGHLLATSTLDPLVWTAVTLLLVRWVRTRDDRLLLAAGAVTAIGLQIKFLLVAFWAVALVAVLICGPREMLRRPALWGGGAFAVLVTLPTLAWQAQNGWPQLAFTRTVAAESEYAGGALGFLPVAVGLGGLLIGTVLTVHGEVALLRAPALRWLGVTVLGVTALFLVTGGRPYYVAGLLPLVWAMSASRIETHRPAVWWRWIPTWPTYVASALFVLGVLNVVPVAPAETHSDQPLVIGHFQRDEIGWPDYVADVRAAHAALLPDTARTAVVVTDDYWTYAALQHYAPDLPSYSYSRGAAYLGTPPEDSGAVLLVGDPRPLAPAFGSVTRIGTLDNELRVNNLTRGTPIFLLQGRTVAWDLLWDRVRDL